MFIALLLAFIGMTGVILLLMVLIAPLLMPYRNKILAKANSEADKLLKEGIAADSERIRTVLSMFKKAHAIKELTEVEANKIEELLRLLVLKGELDDE